MVVNNVNLTDPSQQGADRGGGGGGVWVASPGHPALKQLTEKKYNTWKNKRKYLGRKNLVKPASLPFFLNRHVLGQT